MTSKLIAPRNLNQEMPKIIAWATDAAREHVELAQHFGEEPNPEGSLGLRQSFDYHFPLNQFRAQDRDIALNTAFDTYSAIVKTFSTWTPSKR